MISTVIDYEKQIFQEFLSLALCLLIASTGILYVNVKFSHIH